MENKIVATKRLYELFVLKRDILSEIFQMTKAVSLGKQTENADEYISLIEERTTLFDKLVEIEQDIKKAQCSQASEDELSKDAEQVKEITIQIKDLLTNIMALDRSNTEKASCILQGLKQLLKDANNNKNLNNYYNSDSYSENSSYFDRQK